MVGAVRLKPDTTTLLMYQRRGRTCTDRVRRSRTETMRARTDTTRARTDKRQKISHRHDSGPHRPSSECSHRRSSEHYSARSAIAGFTDAARLAGTPCATRLIENTIASAADHV